MGNGVWDPLFELQKSQHTVGIGGTRVRFVHRCHNSNCDFCTPPPSHRVGRRSMPLAQVAAWALSPCPPFPSAPPFSIHGGGRPREGWIRRTSGTVGFRGPPYPAFAGASTAVVWGGGGDTKGVGFLRVRAHGESIRGPIRSSDSGNRMSESDQDHPLPPRTP